MNARLLITSFTLSLLVAGCGGPAMSGISSHTLRVAPETDVDVVWVVRGDRVFRCTGANGQPSCAEASVGR